MIRLFLKCLPVSFFLLFSASTVLSQHHFASRIQAPPKSQVFEDVGWINWGFSVVKGEDGRYHAYTSRWQPNNLMLWRDESRIYHAVSDRPEGPFTVKAELSQLLEQPWASQSVHNPMVKKLKGNYYLYYASFDADRTHTISVAVSDRASGPWRPSKNNPLIAERAANAWDALPTNPTAVETDDGRIVMVYRAWDGDGERRTKRKLGIAIADDPEGPFVRPENNIISDYHIEDPDIWKENGKYWIIAKDMEGEVTGKKGAGIILESNDAMNWKLSDPVLAHERKIDWADGSSVEYARVERPAVLVVDGQAICLYNAVSLHYRRDCFSVARLLSPADEFSGPGRESGLGLTPSDSDPPIEE
ncbi:MAG: glycoside hydrolase family protein [Opitutales bacterium]